MDVKTEPDILAEVHLLATQDGGRKCPTPSDKFGCPVGFEGEYFDMRIDLSEAGSLSPGMTKEVPIRFLWPELILPRLRMGSEFTLWDGKTIGHGRVTKICGSVYPSSGANAASPRRSL